MIGGRGRGVGRGRAATLPAWMTKGGEDGASVEPVAKPAAQHENAANPAVRACSVPQGQAAGRAAHAPQPSNVFPAQQQMPPRQAPRPAAQAAPWGPSPAMMQQRMQMPPASAGAPRMHAAFGMQPGIARGMPQQAAPPRQAPPTADPNSAAAWTQHSTPEGHVYFHNSVTGQSTYDKPDALKSRAERALPACPWQEFTSPQGRPYFYDSRTQTSVWEEPAELKAFKLRTAQIRALDQANPDAAFAAAKAFAQEQAGEAQPQASQQQQVAPAEAKPQEQAAEKEGGASTRTRPRSEQAKGEKEDEEDEDEDEDEEPSAKRGRTEQPALVFNSDKERREAFEAMIRESSVSSDTPWANARPVLLKDPRFTALRTAGQRKQAYAEITAKLVKEEREATRLAALKARKAFMQMLDEVVGLDDRSSFREMADACSGDDRYEALGEDREREDVFRDWQYAKASEMREKRRRERKGNMEALEKALRSLDPPLTGKDAWRDVEPRIASLQCTKDLEVVDKRDVFARVTRELRVKEAEQEREERKRLLDEERSKRGALRGVVSAKMQAGELDEGAGLTDAKKVLGEDCEELAAVLALTRGEELARAEVRRAEDALVEARKEAEEGIRTAARRGNVLLDASKGWDAAAEKLKGVAETQEEAEARVGARPARSRSASRRSSRSRSRSVAAPATTEGGAAAAAATPRPWVEVLAERFAKPLLEAAVGRVAATQAEEERRRKEQAVEAEERFMELLEDYYYRSEDLHVTWADAARRLGKHSAFTDVEKEEDRERLFKEYMAELAERKRRKREERKRAKKEKKGKKGKKEKKEKKHKRVKKSKKDRKDESDSDLEVGEVGDLEAEEQRGRGRSRSRSRHSKGKRSRSRRSRSPSSSASRSASRSVSRSRSKDRRR